MSQKGKSLLVIIAFVALLVLPVSYAIIKEMMAKHKTEQVQKP